MQWKGLVRQPIYPRKPDPVIRHGLGSRVKVVRIVRRKINGRNRFTVQLICEGYPDHKEKNELGAGDVGIDIGPSTLAIVAPETQKAELRQFCGELKSYQKEIRRMQRKLDRQRRANYPDAFNPNGTAQSGKQQWQVSGREKETRRKLSELYRKQAAYRKSLHGNLANHVFSLSNPVKPEKLSYRAFQGRFGKSVGMRAPVNSLKSSVARLFACVDHGCAVPGDNTPPWLPSGHQRCDPFPALPAVGPRAAPHTADRSPHTGALRSLPLGPAAIQ